MNKNSGWSRLTIVCLGLLLAGGGYLIAADPPPAPKVSSFAPAEDLTRQVDLYLADFETALASEQEYADRQQRVIKDAHTLAAVALALGLHDTPHALKSAAPAVVKTAQGLAAAKDYATAKAAHEALKTAVAGKSTQTAPMTWNQKVGSMGQLMKQVTFINTRLRTGMRRFEQRGEENARNAALLAVIAQAVTVDTHEVKDPADIGKWYQMCAEMRDAAGGVNAAIKAKDQTAANTALMTLTKSCETCHASFRIEIQP